MVDFTVSTPSGPATIRIAFPPSSLLKFPPRGLPETLPAPHRDELTWEQPFNIPPTLYNQLLDVRVPITIAGVYATTVVLINRVNKRRGYKPYAFSQTAWFKLFVILHNVFLAIYSAWTCAGMVKAFRASWPSWNDPNGLLAITDSLCKINGPRGYGNAAIYNTSTDRWTMLNPAYKLAQGDVPDPTDVGRLWNQGLAFLGWIFYLSKFYEVLDTVIILAKGKRSSTLQTYHHAGAMMCMWAGIRYMAPPIWIFTLVNSGIHAMMYTYYTLTALHVRVPTRIKRTLTTMQITQFLVGTAMAASYLFVSYTLPVPRTVTEAVRQLPTAAEGIPSGVSSAAAAAATATGAIPWFKKLALRAAGAEGIAENVGNGQTDTFGNSVTDAAKRAMSQHSQQPVMSYPIVTCMDTTGQAFAIWLNVTYLLPLTYLFARFFVRSYLRRKDPGIPHPTHRHKAEKAGLDALKGVSREVQRAVMEMNGDTSEVTTEDEVVLRKHVKNLQSKAAAAAGKGKDEVSSNGDNGDEGFAKVPSKKGAKKITKEDLQPPPAVPDPKATNPYEVLDENA